MAATGGGEPTKEVITDNEETILKMVPVSVVDGHPNVLESPVNFEVN